MNLLPIILNIPAQHLHSRRGKASQNQNWVSIAFYNPRTKSLVVSHYLGEKDYPLKGTVEETLIILDDMIMNMNSLEVILHSVAPGPPPNLFMSTHRTHNSIKPCFPFSELSYCNLYY